MSIDVDWLELELDSPELISSKNGVESFISELVGSINSKNPGQKIFKYFEVATPLNEKTKNYEVFDSLRHVFSVFISGGLYDLYTHQSNEGWYPKIALDSELTPNDISDLPSSIEIYRGCDISEFTSNKYGQSWSTSIQIAKEFAYQYYAHQSWYKKENRCVLQVTIRKEVVFFSRQNHYEKEIAVNTRKLVNVKKT